MADWNPNLYLKFEKERTQPTKDLIARIEKTKPGRIIDIGCGPGNSTKELQRRWPDAYLVGLDNSTTMIEKARGDLPAIEWVVKDANADLSRLGKFDIVFSNAALQWIPSHESLIVSFFDSLNEGGALAVQVPNVNEMPVTIALETIARQPKWNEYMRTKKDHFYRYSPESYYDLLSGVSGEIFLWQTDYFHVMTGHQGIIDWYRSTGMRPYLDRLPDEGAQNEFVSDVLEQVKKVYPQQKDGRVLFPFRRIFFVAYK